MADIETMLKPNVLWAQRKEMILLRVKMEPSQVIYYYYIHLTEILYICNLFHCCRNLTLKFMKRTWTSKVVYCICLCILNIYNIIII